MKANLRNLSGLTVKELIEHLEELPQDARVFFACDYGDYGHTQQALPVDSVEELTENELEESGYSNSGVALRNSDSDEDEDEKGSDEDPTPIVVLR